MNSTANANGSRISSDSTLTLTSMASIVLLSVFNTHPAGALRAGSAAAGFSSLGHKAGRRAGCGVFSYIHGRILPRPGQAGQ